MEGFRALLHARESVLHDLERAEKDKLKAFEEKEKYLANPPPEQRRMSLTGFIKQKTLVDYVRPFWCLSLCLASFVESIDLVTCFLFLQEDVCQKKTDIVNGLFLTQERMTKGLIHCEIDRFYKDRVEIINTLLGSLAAINLEIALNTNIKWTEVVATAGLDTDQFREIVGVLQQTMDDEDVFQDA